MLSAVAFLRLAETVFVGLVIVKVVQVIFGVLTTFCLHESQSEIVDRLLRDSEAHRRALREISRSPSELGPVIAEEALKELD